MFNAVEVGGRLCHSEGYRDFDTEIFDFLGTESLAEQRGKRKQFIRRHARLAHSLQRVPGNLDWRPTVRRLTAGARTDLVDVLAERMAKVLGIGELSLRPAQNRTAKLR